MQQDSQAHAGPRKLIQACLLVQSSFRPSRLTPDAHLEESLGSSGVSDHEDQAFVKEVFTGLVRYRKFLKPVVDSLYARHRWKCFAFPAFELPYACKSWMTDAHELAVAQFCGAIESCIVCFHIWFLSDWKTLASSSSGVPDSANNGACPESPMMNFPGLISPDNRALVLSQDTIKMVAFIPFISDPQTLSHCQASWSTILDHQVHDTSLQPFCGRCWAPSVCILLAKDPEDDMIHHA